MTTTIRSAGPDDADELSRIAQAAKRYPHAEGFYRRRGTRRIGRVPSTPAGRTLPLLELELRRPQAGRRGDD